MPVLTASRLSEADVAGEGVCVVVIVDAGAIDSCNGSGASTCDVDHFMGAVVELRRGALGGAAKTRTGAGAGAGFGLGS